MGCYLVNHKLWDIMCGKDTSQLEEATARAKWKVKGAWILFAIKISVDDDVLDHIMNVKTPKEA